MLARRFRMRTRCSRRFRVSERSPLVTIILWWAVLFVVLPSVFIALCYAAFGAWVVFG